MGLMSAAPSPFFTKNPWSYSSRFGRADHRVVQPIGVEVLHRLADALLVVGGRDDLQVLPNRQARLMTSPVGRLHDQLEEIDARLRRRPRWRSCSSSPSAVVGEHARAWPRRASDSSRSPRASERCPRPRTGCPTARRRAVRGPAARLRVASPAASDRTPSVGRSARTASAPHTELSTPPDNAMTTPRRRCSCATTATMRLEIRATSAAQSRSRTDEHKFMASMRWQSARGRSALVSPVGQLAC